MEPDDSRHIELWAWAIDPSDIPRSVWVAFTHMPSEASSMTFTFTEPPPEAWHQGVRFRVFIHLGVLEDYTAARRNLQEAVDNPASITPVRRRFDWRYGVLDGAPPGTRSTFPARLPDAEHPDAQHVWTQTPCPWPINGPTQTFGSDGSRPRPALVQRDSSSSPRHGHHDDNDERHDREEAALRRRLLERRRGKPVAGRSSCKEAAFTWPHQEDRDDDNNGGGGDYEHPGHGSRYTDDY